jgi:hypothetical protein
VRLAQQRALEISESLEASDTAIDDAVRWASG